MIKIAFLALVILGFGSLFILDSFAIDFVDSTGYNPSWAKGAGYHYVLNECNYLIGDTSRDGNWCYEWVAYVLDQGVENFPESTKSGSSPTSFKLEDGPLYSGDLTKFLPDKSEYGNDWQVGKPFTMENFAQMKSGGLVDFVSQRIVIPDLWDDTNFLKISFMIMEFEDIQTTSEFYSKTKQAIYSQNFPTVSEYFELESQGIYGDKIELEKSSDYFVADCIGQLINYMQENEEAKLNCIKENYIVAVMVSQKTDLYNTSYTGGGPESSTYDFADIIIGKMIDKTFQDNYGESSGILSINDKTSCLTLVDQAEWVVDNFGNNRCIVKVLKIESGETLNFSRGGMIFNSETNFENYGTFNILGTEDTWAVLDTWGTFENYGTINISGSLGIEEGNFINKGTININNHGSLIAFDNGILENYGVVKNNDRLINHGTINNYCKGSISGNPLGTEWGGTTPINQVPCDDIQKQSPSENPRSKVPEWIKNNAGWWSEGAIDDDAFTQGIQYLVKEKIIDVAVPESQKSSTNEKVPDWIRNNAKWWADGMISEDDFLKGIQYLVESGIIAVENQSPAYEVSENYHVATILTNPYGMGTNTNIVLMIIDPDLGGMKLSLDKVKVTVNEIREIPLTELNPLYANFIDVSDNGTGILTNQFDIDGLFNKGDVLKFEYYDETLYLDTNSGHISVTWTIQ